VRMLAERAYRDGEHNAWSNQLSNMVELAVNGYQMHQSKQCWI